MSLKENVTNYLRVNEIKDALIGLIESKFALKKLEVQEVAENGITDLIYALVAALIGIIILMFFSILLAVGLNNWLESSWYGFAIIGSFYMILLILWLNRQDAAKKAIKNGIEKFIDEKLNAQKNK